MPGSETESGVKTKEGGKKSTTETGIVRREKIDGGVERDLGWKKNIATDSLYDKTP